MKSLERLVCDNCGTFLCEAVQFDLEGNYFYCDDCIEGAREARKKPEPPRWASPPDPPKRKLELWASLPEYPDLRKFHNESGEKLVSVNIWPNDESGGY